MADHHLQPAQALGLALGGITGSCSQVPLDRDPARVFGHLVPWPDFQSVPKQCLSKAGCHLAMRLFNTACDLRPKLRPP